jgi:hypothetical protein
LPGLEHDGPTHESSVILKHYLLGLRTQPDVGLTGYVIFAAIGKGDAVFRSPRDESLAARDTVPHPANLEDVGEIGFQSKVQICDGRLSAAVADLDAFVEPFGKKPNALYVERELGHHELLPIPQIWVGQMNEGLVGKLSRGGKQYRACPTHLEPELRQVTSVLRIEAFPADEAPANIPVSPRAREDWSFLEY